MMDLAHLYCYNCNCKFGVFCREWTAHFPIFVRAKFTALVIMLAVSSTKRNVTVWRLSVCYFYHHKRSSFEVVLYNDINIAFDNIFKAWCT